MRLIVFLKERLYQILLVFFVLFTEEIFLFTVKGALWLGIYLAVVEILLWFFISFIEFWKMKHYYLELTERMELLDKKYFIAEMLEKGKRQEEVLNQKILWEAEKSMIEQVNNYKFANQEYKDYIELWIHEVKLPIAAGKMIIENHRNKITEDIEEELNKIEEYTEQALFYARSNYVEKDYFIRSIELVEIIHTLMIQNKKMLLRKKARINLHDLNVKVFSDSKWLLFILNQILANSIKYADKEYLELEIYAEEEKENRKLFFRDNGAGISKEEIGKVFEKGFTGKRGRNFAGNYQNKATGIGLYLCKKLCKKLEHGIDIKSEEGIGTVLWITFPKGSMVSTVKSSTRY